MKKMNKAMLALGTVAAAAAPIATVISCGGDDNGFSTVVVSDGGSFTDKSFNQQGAEALGDILGHAPATAQKLESAGHTVVEINEKYSAASQNGAKVVLAPGFYHEAAVEKWNSDQGTDTLSFIIADTAMKAANVAGIVYKTKQSSFIAGYMAAKKLTSSDTTGNEVHKVGTFGGGNFPGVTDFMVGFVEGIKYFNANKEATEGTIKFTAPGANDASWTNTGFAPGGLGKTAAEKLATDGAELILPVAGPQVADAIAAMKAKGANHFVIGVDSDQKIAYPSDKAYVFTSILKDVRKSMVDVFRKTKGETTDLSGKTLPAEIKGFGETSIATFANGLTGVEHTAGSDAETIYSALTDEVKTAAEADSLDKTTWTQALADAKAMK